MFGKALLAILVTFCCHFEIVRADHPLVFPWTHAHAAQSAQPATSSLPYQVLPRNLSKHPAAVPLQTMPKTGYAYGWFGSNPTPQVSRHLGFHQNFTQWTVKP